jgi:hypothetical protein
MVDRSGEAVDFKYLETFAAGDQHVIAEVLTLFREQGLTWGPRLDRPDEGWRDLIHSIKGVSRGVGALALGDLAERAERDGPDVLPEVRAGLDATLAAVEGYLARTGGD